MIVTRMQLFCDVDHAADVHFPEDGAVDGAILAASELRSEAKKAGWRRMWSSAPYRYFDLCPECAHAHAQKRLRQIHGKKIHG